MSDYLKLKYNNTAILTIPSWSGFLGVPNKDPFKTVKIGNQIWMAENLAINDGGVGITIKENATVNGVNFGTQYFYNYSAAMRVADSIQGWHLPSTAEWMTLFEYTNCTGDCAALRSITGWSNTNGTNEYGFNALPLANALNYEAGKKAQFATNQVPPGLFSKQGVLEQNKGGVITDWNRNYNISVRLIKD